MDTFTFKKVHLSSSALVYVAWDASACLYVGMSKRGLRRPFTNAILQRRWPEIERLEIHTCQNDSEALTLEGKLTAELKPTLNRSRGLYRQRVHWSKPR